MSIDLSHYPHKCPSCGSPAYQSIFKTYCTEPTCANYDPALNNKSEQPKSSPPISDPYQDPSSTDDFGFSLKSKNLGERKGKVGDSGLVHLFPGETIGIQIDLEVTNSSGRIASVSAREIEEIRRKCRNAFKDLWAAALKEEGKQCS